MNRILLLFTLIQFFSHAYAQCEIDVPSNIVVSSYTRKNNLKKIFKYNDCNANEKNRFLNYIIDFSGVLNPRFLKLSQNIVINKESHIQSLEEFLITHSNLLDRQYIKKSKIVGEERGFFTFDEFDEVRVDCKQCQGLGDYRAQVTHINKKGTLRNHWVNYKVTQKENVLISKSTLTVSHASLDPTRFIWKTIYTEKPENYFTNKDQLSFFKANRNIKKGIPLLRNQVTPMNLVKYGNLTTIKMSNGKILLVGKGLALKAGKLGEIITLKNVRTKKTIMGKITGINTVEAIL